MTDDLITDALAEMTRQSALYPARRTYPVAVSAGDLRLAIDMLAEVSEQTPPDHRSEIEALIGRLGDALMGRAS